MKIGIIGLGRMGNAIADRLIRAGHNVYGYDTNVHAQKAAQEMGITIVHDVASMMRDVSVVWLMVPVGKPVDDVLDVLVPHCKKETIIIDGGNSHYTDSIRRAKMLDSHTIFFLDCGTSGGLQGRELGFCLMVGGPTVAYEKTSEVFQAIAAPDGYAYMGPSGSGHYVKMIHNGIEYALLQAYAEGFELLKEGSFENVQFNLAEIARVWNTSSVIRSWILELAHNVLNHDQTFATISGKIEEGGTGRWTVEEARKHDIQIPTIEQALQVREWSRKTGGNYATKLVALLRNQFGGHAVECQTSEKNDPTLL